MTYEIAYVLVLLAVALVLFVTEVVRMDLVAFLVLVVLAVGGMVSPQQALAGFSNPAVVTVWAMFILSAGLSSTGVADVIGKQVLRVAGKGEVRIIFTVMMAAGVMSAFMNNVGVAALMLPVVMDIARRTGVSPSRLLMPMAYASLLGGLTTLVGTPPNLVASGALEQAGYEPFQLFEFAPIGVPALLIGSLFVALVGRHLLPKEVPEHFQESMQTAGAMLKFDYEIDKHRFQLKVGEGTSVPGQTLESLGLGSVLGLNVYAVRRGDETLTDIDGGFVLRAGDLLFLQGSVEQFQYFLGWRAFEMARGAEISELLALQHIAFLELSLADGSELLGHSVEELGFSSRFPGFIVSVLRGGREIRSGIPLLVLQSGDCLRVETREENVSEYVKSGCFSQVTRIEGDAMDVFYEESQSLFQLEISEWSQFAGRRISETRVGEVLHLRIVGIARKSGENYFPVGDDVFQPGDKLLVQGSRQTEDILHGLQSLELSQGNELGDLHDLDVGLAEVTLSPQSSLAGKKIAEMNFRRRYGLQIQAIWRRGQVLGYGLSNESLELGDAILLTGPGRRIEDLATDADFLVLSRQDVGQPQSKGGGKAWLATLVMLGVIVMVLFGVLPIAVAAIAGVVVMVIGRCLSMDDGYRAIEWQSVFLIACMIPMGTAMQESGAAQWIAGGVASVAEPFGAWGMVIGLYVLTSLATTIVPTTALVLIMAPIAIGAAVRLGISPHLIMMAVAMAASASFTSPISHPANVMVMGPGGYRFIDYVKMGVLLAVVVMLTVVPIIAMMDWS
ncbi:SLC13 family permease [Verrucomicrobiaceae bacterium N1E253]|uniref:SLC13 family permease n=1 Tax=Oceaniferula marina TaxID=2748318 RepID=A0A851GPS5_9BACT|nr:SLC13 family permease [Oceaniferula marina]NWK57007.1 SLC13 family permease [Oceaniferula marina]